MATITYTVTVATGTNQYGTGNKFYINGAVSPDLNLVEGNTYIFDQSDSTNGTHQIAFSTTQNNAEVTITFPSFVLTFFFNSSHLYLENYSNYYIKNKPDECIICYDNFYILKQCPECHCTVCNSCSNKISKCPICRIFY